MNKNFQYMVQRIFTAHTRHPPSKTFTIPLYTIVNSTYPELLVKIPVI